MKHLLILNVLALVLLSGVAAGQATVPADPRLSDPGFISTRDEARAAANCSDRTNPVRTKAPKPHYPDALSRSGVTGTAITEGIVLPDGSVAYTRVVRTNHPDFGTAALEVLKEYRYKPATCGGKPVPTAVIITQTFSQ